TWRACVRPVAVTYPYPSARTWSCRCGSAESTPADPVFLAQVRAEEFADETKGSLTSGFGWARHTLPRTFHVGPMLWQMLSGRKIACIRVATTVDVGSDS